MKYLKHYKNFINETLESEELSFMDIKKLFKEHFKNYRDFMSWVRNDIMDGDKNIDWTFVVSELTDLLGLSKENEPNVDSFVKQIGSTGLRTFKTRDPRIGVRLSFYLD